MGRVVGRAMVMGGFGRHDLLGLRVMPHDRPRGRCLTIVARKPSPSTIATPNSTHNSTHNRVPYL